MSNINVRRAIENIRSGTNVYTPLVETVVNAIQAIEAGAAEPGRIDIRVIRSNQHELDGGQPPVESFAVIDNGIGFDEENRDSFDTLYSDHKIDQGGKGFGRFTCLKYFDDLLIEAANDAASKWVSRRKSSSMKKSKTVRTARSARASHCKKPKGPLQTERSRRLRARLLSVFYRILSSPITSAPK